MGRVVVKMPQLGESVTEGTVERWLKKEGDSVARDEPLVEVVTDKVNAEIPSPFEGKLVRIEAGEGQTVAIGAPIAHMDVEEAPAATTDDAEASAALAEDVEDRVRVNPAIRRLAEERGVDLSAVTGTGAGGRITRGDVLGHPPDTHPSAPPEETSRPRPATVGAATARRSE